MTMAIDNSKPTPSLDAALRWVGDLDHPYYQDERQRFVWYEASAIGFQMVLLLQFLLAGILMLVLGRASFPYLAVGLGPIFVTTSIVAAYAHKRGAKYFPSASDLRRSRGLAGFALIGLYLAGLLRISFDGGLLGDSGFDASLIIGGASGIAAVFVANWLGKRKQAAEESLDD